MSSITRFPLPASGLRTRKPVRSDTDRQHQSDHASAFALRLSPASKGGECLVIPVHRGVSNDIGGAEVHYQTKATARPLSAVFLLDYHLAMFNWTSAQGALESLGGTAS